MPVRTDALISEFETQPSTGVIPQITRHIRNLILSGELAPDTRLPPTRSLASRWHVQGRTVHAALTPLVQEGLLLRTPRRGTFVRERPTRLACVGVYEHLDFGQRPEAAFVRAVQKALDVRLAAAGIEMKLWVDTRPVEASGQSALPSLFDACQRGEIQGVVFPVTTKYHLEWQRKLPVAMAFGATEPVPNAVVYDGISFLECGLRELARLGCKSVGLLSNLATETTPSQGLPHMNAQAYARFFDVMGELNLKVREHWIHAPKLHSPPSAERFGYERFKALWATTPHPDGLIVNDDVMARGVITALLEAGARVPRDLRLVLHRNKEIDLLCPFPATFLESSAEIQAKALMEQVERQFRGEPCERILLPWRVIQEQGGQP